MTKEEIALVKLLAENQREGLVAKGIDYEVQRLDAALANCTKPTLCACGCGEVVRQSPWAGT